MKKQLQKYIRHAFKGLGDMVVNAEIKHSNGSVFNDSTGMNEENFTNYQVKILIDDFDKFEILHSLISPGDFKVFLPVEQIDFIPKPADDSIILNDKEYAIEAVTIKNGVIYILKI